ncbi:MAG: Hsp20/alpha crystallin family protein [Methanotrichaceae archaeon]|nr:Hsp20/alpha crystallin family protein [Methanotrichaceae archaeon]
MHHFIFNSMKGIANKMYLIMDDLGLADIEALYMNQMRGIQKKMGTIAESVPYVSGTVKRPSTDVTETDEAIIVTMEVPGVNKDDIDIEILGDELSVSAKRAMESEHKDECVYKCERNYGVFKRAVRLPADIKSEEARAILCNGVLKITLPKTVMISKTIIGIEELVE